MQLYLSGPMTGLPDYNFPMFRSATKFLLDTGIAVVDPSELDDGNTRMPYTYYLQRDLPLLSKCHGIALLPGWEKSNGACLEFINAVQMGLRVFELTATEPGDPYHEPIEWEIAEVTDLRELYYAAVDATGTVLDKLAKDSGIERGAPPIKLAEILPLLEQESVCQEADHLINGPRQGDYGHPFFDFTRTGRMWGAILGCPDIPAEFVALCMATLKISRECNKPKRDNIVDACGYLGTIELVQQKKNELIAAQQQKAS